MDHHAKTVMEKRIRRTVDALHNNGFDARYVETVGELHEQIKERMPEGASCSVGGSVTLAETGVLKLLESGNYEYYDRYAPGADLPDVYHKALCCDVYFTGSSAITEDGKLFNIDGNGNRLAALIYGPKKVIVVAGANKIVRDLEAARARVKDIATPANALRLSKKVPCIETGRCGDCRSPDRICTFELVVDRQTVTKGRIAVLILPDSLGY